MKKMDEMEMHIALKSVRIAWVYTVVFLLVWIVYEYVTTSEFSYMLFNLLISQNLIFMISQLIFKHRMAGKNEEQD